ncbi:DnaB-like helicase C-terminal domain-containing protein [Microbispora sp. KK1-11]|uniref:replicative DNA helicase n=1 Tax=Microbispora sp. KK1-11 TaxID=2053005 RepID=UPI00115AEA03|nr:DnaB-like helicase C-terminal domain-containing protein [Microbispora sp. KK1-11]TQS30020.1 AAA family ATPase [Microbispora sp. KK1-11]
MSLDDLTLTGFTPSPAVIAAEMAIVGAAIQSKAALDEAAALLTPEDFYSEAGMVFAAAQDVLADGRTVEPATVMGALQARGDLLKVGGGPYLGKLIEHAAYGNIATLAEDVSADAQRRRVQQACQRGARMTTSGVWDPDADLDMIRKLLDEAATRRTGEMPSGVADEMAALLEELENPPTVQAGVAPPYKDLQRLIPSFLPGGLYVVGARPSYGKSTVGVDAAREAAIHQGIDTVVFTLEMPKKQVLQRISAAESGVQLTSIIEHTVTRSELERITDAGVRICAAPLTVDYAPGCTVDRIRATLRSKMRTSPAGLVVVDYLGLMRGPRAESRQQEVAAISRELKLMAGEFDVPIVALSQLNRKPEDRADRKPQMSDLRDSGAVEQDADAVILIHRDKDPESPRAGEVDLIVEKNRNGPTGVIAVASQLHYARFVDMAPNHTAPSGRPNLRAV